MRSNTCKLTSRIGYKNILVNLDDAPKVERATDLEICIMSARSAQRTRRRRWRMGRDRAGEREMRTHGRRVASRHLSLSSREGSDAFCFFRAAMPPLLMKQISLFTYIKIYRKIILELSYDCTRKIIAVKMVLILAAPSSEDEKSVCAVNSMSTAATWLLSTLKRSCA